MNNFELTEKFESIINKFDISGDYFYCEPFGEGHINGTYAVYFKSNCCPTKRYILQKINTSIFKEPKLLMENIVNVTNYLKVKIKENAKDVSRRVLNLVKTKNGEFYLNHDNEYYRVYDFIENATCYQLTTTELFKESARAFGEFQQLLDGFDSTKLHETIKRFHDTPNRFEIFKEAVKLDKVSRLANVQKEVDFVLKREDEMSFIIDRIKDKSIPLRVTHNDTKLNNVLIDNETQKGLCVIDLDTVMPGSILYDFGDSIRFGASNALEDEVCLDKVFLREDLFENYTYGFLEKVYSSLNQIEIDSLPMGAKLMTLECGMRFLTDYLDGDNYFKIHRENHNLDRARTQFKLVEDMENKMNNLIKIVHSFK